MSGVEATIPEYSGGRQEASLTIVEGSLHKGEAFTSEMKTGELSGPDELSPPVALRPAEVTSSAGPGSPPAPALLLQGVDFGAILLMFVKNL